MLHLLHASPVMWVAKDNLHRIGSDRFGKVCKGSDCYIACEWRLNSSGKQLLPYVGHSGDVCGWILKISAIGEFLAQGCPNLNRSRDRPRAIGIETNRNFRAELCAKLPHSFDLLRRVENTRFELDLAKSILRKHLAHLRDQFLRRERLSILIRTKVVSLAASPGMLIERIRREGY